MSTESTASETTPLRCAENRYSKDATLLPTAATSFNGNTPTNNRQFSNNNNNNNNNNTSSARSSRSSGNSASTTVTTAATVAAASLNNNIEIRLGNTTNNNNNNNNSSSSSSNNNNNNNSSLLEMDTNKRILFRVGLDVLILLCVGAPILGFFLWGDSYKRGFFCDDESLKHPFKESTVRNWMLYIIGLVIPLGVILIVEITRSRHNAAITNGNTTGRRYVFMDYEFPDWMVECYKKIGVFGFGAAASQLVTDIAKYSIGRLRPHFFAVCQPVLPDGSTCADTANAGLYIQDFTCQGVGSTARMLKEVRLSFPSGHSSFTFFTMVYLALYLQSRMSWRGSKLLRHFLQFAFIMIAWYTALSRVSDYKHHWSDVLAGSTIGALCAVIVANYVSDLFEGKSTKSYMLPRTTQDMRSPPTTTNGY